MKQFNLKEYLENPSRKIVTRDGRNARIICTDKKGVCPIVALIEKSDGVVEETIIYKENGEVFGTTTTKYDFFFTPEKHEGWTNIYRGSDNSRYVITRPIFGPKEESIFESKEEAEKEGKRHIDYMTTVKIEWEE